MVVDGFKDFKTMGKKYNVEYEKYVVICWLSIS